MPTDNRNTIVFDSVARAEKTLKVLTAVKNSRKAIKISFAKSLPSMLQQNGLGQTLAFMNMKQKDVFGVFQKLMFDKPEYDGKDFSGIMEHLLGLADSMEYINLQREAVGYAGWIKLFAVALFPESE